MRCVCLSLMLPEHVGVITVLGEMGLPEESRCGGGEGVEGWKGGGERENILGSLSGLFRSISMSSQLPLVAVMNSSLLFSLPPTGLFFTVLPLAFHLQLSSMNLY